MARILIVEDEAILAMTVQMELERMGHEVTGVADTVDDALIQADRTRPDIILLDIVLKGNQSGIDLGRTVSNGHLSRIIYMTAHTDQATIDRAGVTHHHGFIHKPFDHHQLTAAIEEALTQPL